MSSYQLPTAITVAETDQMISSLTYEQLSKNKVISQLERERDDGKSKLRTTTAALESTLADASKQNAELSKELQSAKANISALEQAKSSLLKEKAEMRKEMRNLTVDLQASDTQCKTLNASNKGLERLVDSKKKELVKAMAQLKSSQVYFRAQMRLSTNMQACMVQLLLLHMVLLEDSSDLSDLDDISIASSDESTPSSNDSTSSSSDPTSSSDDSTSSSDMSTLSTSTSTSKPPPSKRRKVGL